MSQSTLKRRVAQRRRLATGRCPTRRLEPVPPPPPEPRPDELTR